MKSPSDKLQEKKNTPPAQAPEAENAVAAEASPMEATGSFDTLGLSPDVLRGAMEAGYKSPTPIQAAAIPLVLAGHDLIAQARTGTGKTAAFGLPAMSLLKSNTQVEILVITPTRELASQVSDELFKLGRAAKVRSVAVYGGQSSSRQVELISRGANCVVATPGRLLDLLESGRMKNFAPSIVILDEADEMLDMGFLEDIQKIFEHLPSRDVKPRQTLMFSATMPPPIRKLANDILKDPQTINLVNADATNTDVEQSFYIIEESERLDAVVRIIDAEEPGKAILFCRTKREADELCDVLISRGLQVKALHGDVEQDQRQDIIKAFKSGKLEMLVATDVAARGLDVTGVTHVFNYHMPFDQAGYVHRIGRTGRAGQKGKAVTLVNPFEFRSLKRLQHAIKASFIHREVPSASDIHLKEDTKLIDAVANTEVSEEAVELLLRLESQLDLPQIACKLISMHLAKRNVRGPHAIGVRGTKLNNLLGQNQGAPTGGDYGQKKRPFHRPRGPFVAGGRYEDRRGPAASGPAAGPTGGPRKEAGAGGGGFDPRRSSGDRPLGPQFGNFKKRKGK